MEIVKKKITEIKPYKNNPRNNKAAIAKVAKSIELYGFQSPIILDKNNEIIAGHSRYLAALSLNLESVPCIYAMKDGKPLTKKEAQRLRIADNSTSDYSMWDMSLLTSELEDIDLYNDTEYTVNELTGFEDNQFIEPEYTPENKEKTTHKVKVEHTCPECGHIF